MHDAGFTPHTASLYSDAAGHAGRVALEHSLRVGPEVSPSADGWSPFCKQLDRAVATKVSALVGVPPGSEALREAFRTNAEGYVAITPGYYVGVAGATANLYADGRLSDALFSSETHLSSKPTITARP